MVGLTDYEARFIDLNDLIQFAEVYSKLGWAIQKQLNKLLNGETEGLNPNAVRAMRDLLRPLGPISETCFYELQDLLDSWEQARA